ncbi:MFS transporter [Hoeflea ulvae]|uniref:MFS transporter n=1 Tax=Hoeflea ulvae TaxID=2983764 RepID=A0ABT3YH66_9HYPH|nr:MFS transporter [Hoeflea ulvae]MCY0095242.1 MFS transporter [Hoeflea ulvae]
MATASTPASARQPIALPKIIAYALPAIPLAALTLPLYVLVPTFYTETLGLSLASVGFALLLVRIFDAVNDPLIGWAADRFRPRFGRRRSLFALSLPLTAISAFMLFWPPVGVTTAWLVGWGLMLSLGYTAALIPFSAWGAELATDYHGRSRVTGWREGLTLVGTLIAIALPFAIGFDRATGVHGLAALALVILIALPLFGTVAIIFTPEPAEHSRSRVNLKSGLAHLARNRPFLRLIAAFFLNGLANGIPATLFLYFVSARLGLPDARGPLLFFYFLCAIAGVPLATWAARRVGKHRAWCYGMLAACLAFAPAPVLPEGSLIAFAAICAITGLLLGFDLALPPAIQADVIDVDTAASGEQRSGTYFAAWSLATKLSLAGGVGIVFPVLAGFGFDPASSSETGAGLTALAIAYAWVPIAAKLVSIAIMWNFPLDEAAQKSLRGQIEAG